MDLSYWHTQTPTKPLFPDIECNRPERRDQAGRLGIIGGNKLGFASVAESYTTAYQVGAGDVRVLLPDVLKKSLPAAITDAVYGATTPSGSLSKQALDEMRALGEWATGILLVGDAGRNSETAIAYEDFISHYSGPLTLTRDAIDLVKNSPHLLVERDQTLLVASFAQTQKLFQHVYYPKVLTFAMPLLQLVEALHKFTITYPCHIATLHHDTLVIASAGRIVTQDFDEPMRIWRGEIATRMATYWLWNHTKALEAAATAIARPNE
ncbi:hypothetical protein CR983_00880 [Candidatus Saccharibacteria bacterium]|nr:MAG: hypothetical protein CR983_00880 [Candidatus Saccharibacteria bacterium]